jgi:ABC-type Zn uptake system ZnuABC Zn-binding protein ZnuA
MYKHKMDVAYRGFPLILLLMLGATAGCDKSPAAKVATRDKVHVVATAYPLADIAKQVGGDAVECDWISEQGQSLDAADPTPEARAKIRRGEMILTSGFGEEWAVEGFDDPVRARAIVRLDVLDSAKADAGSRQLWLDPLVAKELARVIAERLVAHEPDQAARFRESARRFGAEIDTIINASATKLTPLKGRKVLVLSTDYSALVRRFGLQEIRPVTTSPLRLSDDDFMKLRDAVRSDAPLAMLVEAGLPPAVQQDLSQRLGLPVIALDSLGTSAGVGRNTYQAILRYDLEQLSTLASSRE